MKTTAAIELLLQLTGQIAQLGAVIRQARADGREELTHDELLAVVAVNDAARARLVDAIERAG
jgi:adenine/guanine phosphoribosyltransferase-like PRPP-binding protein